MKKKVTREDFIDRANKIHGDKYDYSLISYINMSTKVKIFCPIHGEFEQVPSSHLEGNGCPFCKYDNHRLTLEEFINRSQKVHGNKYDYSMVNYQTNSIPVDIICPIHKGFKKRPSAHFKGEGCPKCGVLNKFIKKAKTIHNNKYNYDKVIYNSHYTKVIITCPIHGDFEQSPNNHLSGYGCKKCSDDKNRISHADFIKKASSVHNQTYDYSETNYKDSYEKVKIICPIHGEFFQLPHVHLAGSGCPRCRRSKGEEAISRFFEKNQIIFKAQAILNQNNLKTSPLRFDFYIPHYDLYVEYQGEQHFFPVRFGGMTEEKAKIAFEKGQKRDQYKRNWCKENNHKLLEITYKEFNKIEEILTNYIGELQ